MHFNLNKSLEQLDVDAKICMAVENSSPINVELNSNCNLHHSINEIEMNSSILRLLIMNCYLPVGKTKKQS